MLRITRILTLALFLVGCAQAVATQNPAWVDGLIKGFENQAVGNPPQSIWRYDYNGQSVYYVPAQCCDQYSALYDASGAVLCAPDGGIAGKGDGKCSDFFEKRTNEQLIWKDSRSR